MLRQMTSTLSVSLSLPPLVTCSLLPSSLHYCLALPLYMDLVDGLCVLPKSLIQSYSNGDCLIHSRGSVLSYRKRICKSCICRRECAGRNGERGQSKRR
ncbi:hypothetical protein K469DRAFT_4151 [Zopfia rhizophila CBS 207.26]|uniref:Secreted protein n=1 Tax=Zopfia rhizophila CBS 207.26 TaxID=1314779 RepID=A0A6A6EVA5_9PEZI|nr:hypothetical protein K469DRAFT_4151 [Zopfia rhizophila CBS 207.26]